MYYIDEHIRIYLFIIYIYKISIKKKFFKNYHYIIILNNLIIKLN